MIASTQITNTETFAFVAVPVFKLLCRKALVINKKGNRNCYKKQAIFEKIANFVNKLRQNYKQLECELFMVLLKHVSDHLVVLFQFA